MKLFGRYLALAIAVAFLSLSQINCAKDQSSGTTAQQQKPGGDQSSNSAPAASATPPDQSNQQPSQQQGSSASSDQASASNPGSNPSTSPVSGQQPAQQPQQASPPPPPPPPRTYTLAAGKTLAVYTSSTLSTKTNKTGEPFSATLAAPISSGDWVVARKGARVDGVIVDSDPGGKVKGVASMKVRLTRLALADGRTVPLSTSVFAIQAKSTKKKDAAKIGIGAGAGALIGGIAGGGKGAGIGAAIGGGAGTGVVLATRGDPAVIHGESRLNFRLAESITITEVRVP